MPWIFVNTILQKMFLYDDDRVIAEYAVSTGKNGLGEDINSEKTPRGWHCVAEKIGEDAAVNTVFISRKPTGEIYADQLAAQFPTRDWILTRILWLSGLEAGFNQGGNVDTYARYIYIHGCPDKTSFSQPSSHGCVRMHNADILALYDAVAIQTPVYIGDTFPDNHQEYTV